MARFEVKLPKMGESVAEATITSWVKNVGDSIEMDESIVEIATDKVDSEVPSEVEGKLVEILFDTDAVVKVGETIAIIETPGEDEVPENGIHKKIEEAPIEEALHLENEISEIIQTKSVDEPTSGRFYSPLVRKIAETEGISIDELERIAGTGKEGRVTKDDILSYLESGSKQEVTQPLAEPAVSEVSNLQERKISKTVVPVPSTGEDEIIELSRMGKLIAKHMVDSVQTSAHVQSFIEVDVTNIVKWRNRIKDDFLKREGEKITYTPIFMQAVAKAIKDNPLINISISEDKVIKRAAINLGMAVALSDGNLIVPVIKNADQLNLIGMTKVINDLAQRARSNKLLPDDVQGGTYTVTNVGSYGSLFGTPIINQPQVGILALGAIRKVPAVIETSEGDFVGIRHRMFLSHSYDHRVVNGALGSIFIKQIKEHLEAWDANADF
jgi:2-oxoglutarate dehydrogenase E2 component (dihydrolipoamide succinyltransferase)